MNRRRCWVAILSIVMSCLFFIGCSGKQTLTDGKQAFQKKLIGAWQMESITKEQGVKWLLTFDSIGICTVGGFGTGLGSQCEYVVMDDNFVQLKGRNSESLAVLKITIDGDQGVLVIYKDESSYEVKDGKVNILNSTGEGFNLKKINRIEDIK